MKKSLIITIAVICAAVVLSSVLFSGAAVKTSAEAPVVSETKAFDEAAFLNILNDNYVYGSDFDDIDDIVNCSVNKFKASVSDEGYISAKLLCDYVYDMYGIEIVDLSKLNPEYEYRPGFVYALPAFTEYKHENVELSENEDRTVTAISDITVYSLDGNGEKLKAKSLLVKNENSKYGYNLVYSEIYSENASM